MSGVSRPSRGHRRRSDSDSEDELTSDHTSGPDYDSAGDRDEINERILQALERLHQDMKSVLRRLNTMEEALLSRQVGCHILIKSVLWVIAYKEDFIYFLFLLIKGLK